MKKNNIYFAYLLFSTLFIAGFYSCNEKDEGCLDPLAINFRASATVSCCCNYATMRFQWFPHYQGLPYSDSLPVMDAAGNSFYLREMDLLFSEAVLYLADGKVAGILDELNIIDLSDSLIHPMTDDVFRLHLGSQFSSAGSVRAKGMAENLIFRTGISSLWNRSNHFELSASHPLVRPPSLFLSPDIGYAVVRLLVSQTLEEEGGLEILIPGNTFSIVSITLDYEVPGNQNFDIPLAIDLNVLFEGVSVQGMALNAMGARISENLSLALYQHIP